MDVGDIKNIYVDFIRRKNLINNWITEHVKFPPAVRYRGFIVISVLLVQSFS